MKTFIIGLWPFFSYKAVNNVMFQKCDYPDRILNSIPKMLLFWYKMWSKAIRKVHLVFSVCWQFIKQYIKKKLLQVLYGFVIYFLSNFIFTYLCCYWSAWGEIMLFLSWISLKLFLKTVMGYQNFPFLLCMYANFQKSSWINLKCNEKSLVLKLH